MFGQDEASYASTVSDFDGDGDLDILIGNVQGQNAIYLNEDGGRSWHEVHVGVEHESTYGVAAADVDGDGRADVAFANSESLNRLFLNVSAR